MILLSRSPEPEILGEKKAEWTAKFLARRKTDPEAKPPPSQYAHDSVKRALEAMSDGKCFFCECKLDEQEREVDHYVEHTEAPEHAFEWDNLYLSHKGCNNGKPSNRSLPCAGCIDPCATDRRTPTSSSTTSSFGHAMTPRGGARRSASTGSTAAI